MLRDHALADDVHERVASRLLAEGLTPDVGCGEGELERHLADGHWGGLDSSGEMPARAPQPTVQADAGRLPFPDGSFGSVALLYVLYHMSAPALALGEAGRVKRDHYLAEGWGLHPGLAPPAHTRALAVL